MVVLFDTDIILDYLTKRQPFYDSARAVFELCAKDEVQGYVAFHSLPNIFYILRNAYSISERRSLLKNLCKVLRVTGASHDKVIDAIEREDFTDFEDCLQDKCASECGADFIVTRNMQDYKHADTEVASPQLLMEIFSNADKDRLT